MRGTAEPMEGVFEPMSHDATVKRHGRRMSRRLLGAVVGAAVLAGSAAATASAQQYPVTSGDPRIGLAAGPGDTAGKVSLGMQHLSNTPLPPVVNSINSDAAFQGNYAFVGNFNGVNIYDVSNPAAPALVTALSCIGSQNDVSVHGNLLFVSVESANAKRDCTASNATGRPTPRRASAASASSTSRTSATRAHPGRRRADLPRLAHAHAADAEERPEQRLHLRLGHVVAVRAATTARRPATPTPRPPTRTRRSGGSRSSRSRSPTRAPRPS